MLTNLEVNLSSSLALEDNHTDIYGRIDSFDSGTVKTVNASGGQCVTA